MRFNKEELLKILVKKGEINQKDINFKFDNELDFFKKLILLSENSFKFFPYEYKDNYEIAYEAIKANWYNYFYASEKIKNNKDLVISLLREKDSGYYEGFYQKL